MLAWKSDNSRLDGQWIREESCFSKTTINLLNVRETVLSLTPNLKAKSKCGIWISIAVIAGWYKYFFQPNVFSNIILAHAASVPLLLNLFVMIQHQLASATTQGSSAAKNISGSSAATSIPGSAAAWYTSASSPIFSESAAWLINLQSLYMCTFHCVHRAMNKQCATKINQNLFFYVEEMSNPCWQLETNQDHPCCLVKLDVLLQNDTRKSIFFDRISCHFNACF